MPENNSPTKPESTVSPGELDFTQPVAESPRIKRRSLKARQPTSPSPSTSLKPAGSGAPPAARELAREAPPRSSEEAKPELKPEPEGDMEINAAVKITEPSSARPGLAGPAARPAPTANSTTSPHGTRPATLYYSTGLRKEKEETIPMKSTPTASPAPSSSTTSPASSPPRPTASTSSTRPVSVVDYRTNVERQAREQKSVGSLLAILVYSLVGLFVVGAGLAGYGAHVIFVQLHQQSITVGDLDNRFSAEDRALNVKLATTVDTLTEAQAQLAREQELILKQQEMINQLLALNATNASAIRQEKQARAEEAEQLRERIKSLEYTRTTTQRY